MPIITKTRWKKRPTKALKEVMGTDLLSATEKYIKNELGGFYSLSDEQAYFKTSHKEGVMNVFEFEKKLKRELHPNFFVIFNPNMTAEHICIGHNIGFFVPEYDAFEPICKVGRSGFQTIEPNTQGKRTNYKGNRYYKFGHEDEEANMWRGWLAAFEACRLYLQKLNREPIRRGRCISKKEFLLYKKAVHEVSPDRLHKGFESIKKAEFEKQRKEALQRVEANNKMLYEHLTSGKVDVPEEKLNELSTPTGETNESL